MLGIIVVIAVHYFNRTIVSMRIESVKSEVVPQNGASVLLKL